VHPYTHRGRAEEGGWSRREPGRGIGEKRLVQQDRKREEEVLFMWTYAQVADQRWSEAGHMVRRRQSRTWRKTTRSKSSGSSGRRAVGDI
jgi:hypothetical protein